MNSNAGWFVGEEPVAQELVETQCFGCLSSHRKLSNLGDNLLVFSQLFNDQYSTLDQKVLLCWECGAQLKKARLFKEKVENAQQQLRFWSKNQKKCLSSLIISTEVWTIGEVPQETIKSPENLQETFNKPMVNIPKTYGATWVEDGIAIPNMKKPDTPKSKYPETWIKEGISLPDTRKSRRIEKIEQENPIPNKYTGKRTKNQKHKKETTPVTLPVSFRQARKCKQVIPVNPTLKNDGKVEIEIKNEILEDDESFDNYEADYDDEQDIKDEDETKSGKLQPKLEPNTDYKTSVEDNNTMIGDNLSDTGDIEDDFEWPLEEEEKAIDKTKTDKKDWTEILKKRREIEKEIEQKENDGDSDVELSLDARKYKKLKNSMEEEEDPDFEVSDDIKKSLNVKSSKNKSKPSTSKEEQASETTERKKGRKKRQFDEDPIHLPYKKVFPTTKVSMKRVTVSVLEIAVLLEQDRNSDCFDKLRSNKCKKCVKVIPIDKITRHIKDHKQTEENSHLCNLCELPFSSEETKAQHMSSSHTSALECSKCGFKCTLLEFMAIHLWGHRQQVYQCLGCNVQYESKEEFYKHYCICDICNKTVKNKNMLVRHMYYRHLPHKCKYCGKQLKNYKTYDQHVNALHQQGLTEDSYCVACDRQFLNRILFERHIETSLAHKGERVPRPCEERKATESYKCPECPNTYKSKTSVREHYNYVHKQEFHHKCKLCDKVYSKNGGLKEHIRTVHEGKRAEKNKFCNICGRGFAHKRILEHHIRTHTGERPFKCEYCDSSFAQRTPMLYHVKHIHQNVKRKPYVPKRAGARASHNVSSGSQNLNDVSSGSGSQSVIVDNVPDGGASYSGYTSGFYGYQ